MTRNEGIDAANATARVVTKSGRIGTATGYEIFGPRICVVWDDGQRQLVRPSLIELAEGEPA